MRKLGTILAITLIVVGLLLPTLLVRASTLYEYYNTGDDQTVLFAVAHWEAQTFTPTTNHTITSVKLKLCRTGLPGNVTISIRATNVTTGYPVGNDLCNGTTNSGTLPTDENNAEWRRITLGDGYNLSSGTKYAIIARAIDGDENNQVGWRSDETTPTYENGTYVTSSNSGVSWFAPPTMDLMFEEYASTTSVITTNNATYVERTTAQLNAYVVDDGGEDCDVRFQYGNSTGNYTSNTSWVNDTYTTGDSPYVDVTSLPVNTTYYFRVQIENTLGTANGSELNFTTYNAIFEPTDFRAYPNSTSISLSWVKGENATNTIIRGQAGAYPASYNNGKEVYNGSMSTALDTGLTLGTTYYYRAWSYDDLGHSASYTDIIMTTTASTAVTQDTPATPTTPSSWWGTPDYTGLSNLAGYGIVNTIADNFEIPRNTFWMSLIILGIMCLGLFIYSVQHNATVAIMLTSVCIIVAAIAGLLPLLFIAIIGIPAVGIFLVKRRI